MAFVVITARFICAMSCMLMMAFCCIPFAMASPKSGEVASRSAAKSSAVWSGDAPGMARRAARLRRSGSSVKSWITLRVFPSEYSAKWSPLWSVSTKWTSAWRAQDWSSKAVFSMSYKTIVVPAGSWPSAVSRFDTAPGGSGMDLPGVVREEMILKAETFWGFPLSKTVKSSCFRSATAWPLLWTTTSTSTSRVLTRRTLVSWAITAWAAAARQNTPIHLTVPTI